MIIDMYLQKSFLSFCVSMFPRSTMNRNNEVTKQRSFYRFWEEGVKNIVAKGKERKRCIRYICGIRSIRVAIHTSHLFLFFLFFLLCSPLLAGAPFQLSLLRSEITSQTHLLNLQEQIDSDKLFHKELFQEGHFSFPFTNYRNFKYAVNTFLTATESEQSLIDYQVVDEAISGRLQVSLGGGIDYHTDFDEYYLHPYRRVHIKGNIHNRLFFWGDWWAGRFQGDLDYAEKTSPLIDGWHKSHQLPGQTYTNLNNLSGQISYLFDFGSVTVGRGKHRVGDTISGSIILNDAANDYGYFGCEIDFGKLTLSFLHASLIPDERDPTYSDPYYGVFYVDKFLAKHQLTYNPLPNLQLFFGEQVIYANRGIDVNYLLPHTFYRIIEHNLHDRDNMLIYGGGRWEVTDNIALYGNLALDELRKSEIFGDWWGNQYALQGGASFKFLPGLLDPQNKPVQTTVEATAVRPWVYTHKSYHTNTSHDGIGLGFPGHDSSLSKTGRGKNGSNIIQGAIEIDFPIQPYLDFNLFTSAARQGSWGNCWSLNYTDDRRVNGELQDTAKWLEGDKTDFLRSKGVFTLSPLAHHQLKIGMEWFRETGQDWQNELVLSYGFMY